MSPAPATAPRTPAGDPSARWALLALLLVVLPCFLALDQPPLWDANEPLYAEPPREVVSWPQGDFWAPTWNGTVFYAHPPLSTWVTVPFYRLLGPSETAARLPMAIAAVLTVLATFALGRRIGGTSFGFLAALVLAATPRYWLYARQLAGDVYLVALLTSAFALVAHVLDGERRTGRTALACVVVAIGALAKGPVILVLFGAPLGLAWLFSRPRAPLRLGRVAAWSLLTAALSAPWFVYMALRFPDFLAEHFGRFTVGRITGEVGERGLFFYVVALLGDAQPWILLLPFALWRAWRSKDRRGTTLLPWVVVLVTFAVFTASLGKRNVYMLPIYPMLALALTPLLLALARLGRSRATRAAGLVMAVVALVGAAGLWILQHRAPGLRPEILWLLAAVLAAGAGAVFAAFRGGGRAVLAALIAGLWVVEVAGALTLPALGRYRPVPALAAAIASRQDAAQPEPAVVYRVAIHSLNFYLGRPTVVAHDPDEVRTIAAGRDRIFVLTREDRARDLTPEATGGYVFDEVARGPFLSLQFRNVILGRGPVTRDLVLLEGRPAGSGS